MGGREVVLPEPHPSTTVSWIAPMEAMGRASVRKPQLDGGRSRVRDRRGGVWHPLTITINSI